MTAGSLLSDASSMKDRPLNTGRYYDEMSNPFKTAHHPRVPASMRLERTRGRTSPTSSGTGFNKFQPQPFKIDKATSTQYSSDPLLKTRIDKGYSNETDSSRVDLFSPLRQSEEAGFKSALEVFPDSERSFLFEDKMAMLTNSQFPRNSKDWILQDEKGEADMLKNRSNSMDEVLSHIFQDEEQGESIKNFQLDGVEEITKGVKRKKYIISLFIFALMIFVLGSATLDSIPILTCNGTIDVCFPQLKVQLIDKSPVAIRTLTTVKEALKVLSYLALDFGDTNSELDLINDSLDSYYQEKVIDTFSVDTTYLINPLGYCRHSKK